MRSTAALVSLAVACHSVSDDAPPPVASTTLASAASPEIIYSLTASPAPPPIATAMDDLEFKSELAGIGEGGGQEDPRPRLIPALRFGELSVAGKYRPNFVRRIVRQNAPAVRACYLAALTRDDSLAGPLTTKFDIDPHGTTRNVASQSAMSDTALLRCVEKVFATLSFPAPEAGTVKASAEILFAPPKAAFTIGGTPSPSVRESDLVNALKAAGYEIGADKPWQQNAQVTHFAVSKGAIKLKLTLDTDRQLSIGDYERLKREELVLEDGPFVLGVIGDKAAAQALIDAIHVKLPK